MGPFFLTEKQTPEGSTFLNWTIVRSSKENQRTILEENHLLRDWQPFKLFLIIIDQIICVFEGLAQVAGPWRRRFFMSSFFVKEYPLNGWFTGKRLVKMFLRWEWERHQRTLCQHHQFITILGGFFSSPSLSSSSLVLFLVKFEPVKLLTSSANRRDVFWKFIILTLKRCWGIECTIIVPKESQAPTWPDQY